MTRRTVGALVAQLARQGPPSLAAFAPRPRFGVALADFTRARAPQKFGKVFCRLDREWLDCVVLKTHIEAVEPTVVPLR